MSSTSRVTRNALLAVGLGLIASLANAATPLSTVRVVSGLTKPVWVGSPPGDNHRLFVVEQKVTPASTGRIRIVKDGVLLPAAFLSVTGNSTGNEQGLLGICFDPNFMTNGVMFISANKAGGQGTTQIDRVTVSDPNADVASVVSTFNLLTLPQPATNHNGGGIAIGPDGALWVPLGDGGSQNDPNCNAQNGSLLFGKILRLDPVTGGAAAGNPALPGFDARIWSYGMRNPWRWSFDRANGDLYVGDVGQDAFEEIDYVAAPSAGGINFGWKVMEANACGPGTSSCAPGQPLCNDPSYVGPVHTWAQAGTGACAIIGGYVYRGCAIPDLQGTYFFADNCNNQIWSFKMVNGVKTALTNRTAELVPSTPGTSITSISSFGEDNHGEVYICDLNGGEIFKIVPNPSVPAPSADLGSGKVGGNGKKPLLSTCGLLSIGESCEVDLEDAPANRLSLLLASLSQSPVPAFGGTFVPGAPLVCVAVLNTDANGRIDLAVGGGSGPVTFYAQYLIDDPGATAGVGMSNALKIDFQP